MRRGALAAGAVAACAIAAAAIGGSCGSGGGGAVVVRWRLVDPETGSDPCGCTAPAASQAQSSWCCVNVGSLTGSCSPPTGNDVVIDSVRLRIRSLADGGVAGPEVPCASCCAGCADVEHTTSFEIPPGDYVLSIEALRCGVPIGATPPGLVRTVRAGEITNLNAIEIVVPATANGPVSCGDAGAPGCPDGGT